MTRKKNWGPRPSKKQSGPTKRACRRSRGGGRTKGTE